LRFTISKIAHPDPQYVFYFPLTFRKFDAEMKRQPPLPPSENNIGGKIKD